MNQEEYIRLYEKSLTGMLSVEEQKQLDAYADDFSLDNHHWDEKLMGNQDDVKQLIMQKVFADTTLKPKKVFHLKLWIAAASIVIALISSGLYFYSQHNDLKNTIAKTDIGKDILPGSNKAILTLSDGSTVALGEEKDGVIRKDKDSEISKLKTSLVYTRLAGGNKASKTYNTVVIPNGGQYQIQLEDGTKVWLNAASSLRFPVAFTDKDRVVELKGEAYFEVAKNPGRPFKVKSYSAKDDEVMSVEVLGTHFNISAYPDEDFKTTLTEGSVRVSNHAQKSLVIKPGEQSILNQSSGDMLAKPANLKEVLAWKNGFFIFDHENIESIMRKLSRWYSIEVSYEGKLSNKEFVATISRNENLSEVLKMLALTGTVEFDVKGKKVVVK